MADIVKQNFSLSASYADQVPKLEEFLKRLHAAPEQDEIKINKQANNSAYLPISFIQNKLDEHFAGLWQTKNFKTQVIANEITGSIDLEVFHPVAKTWITRTGVGAVMIQMRSKKNGGSGDITNIRDKYSNTLVKDYPHLYAECVKSAAKTLGLSFGRDLNREFVDKYNPIYSQEVQIGQIREGLETSLEECTTTEELMTVWNSYEAYHDNPLLRKIFTSYKSKLSFIKPSQNGNGQ